MNRDYERRRDLLLLHADSPPPWTPAAVPGCAVWCETDTTAHPTAVVLNAGTVAQLTDLSGNSRHFTQAAPADQPTWVPAGAGGLLSFDGVSDFMRTPSFILAQPNTIYVLTNWTYVLNTNLFDSRGNPNRHHVACTAAGTMMFAGDVATSALVCTGAPAILDFTFDGVNSYAGRDGAARVQTDVSVGTQATDGITLAMWSGGASWSTQSMGGFLLYHGTHDEATRQRVVQYLRELGARLGWAIA